MQTSARIGRISSPDLVLLKQARASIIGGILRALQFDSELLHCLAFCPCFFCSFASVSYARRYLASLWHRCCSLSCACLGRTTALLDALHCRGHYIHKTTRARRGMLSHPAERRCWRPWQQPPRQLRQPQPQPPPRRSSPESLSSNSQPDAHMASMPHPIILIENFAHCHTKEGGSSDLATCSSKYCLASAALTAAIPA